MYSYGSEMIFGICTTPIGFKQDQFLSTLRARFGDGRGSLGPARAGLSIRLSAS